MLADSADRESTFCSEGSTTFKKGGNLLVNDSLFFFTSAQSDRHLCCSLPS